MLKNTDGLKINSEGRISRRDRDRRKLEIAQSEREAARREAQREAAAADIRRAENLRKSRAIANVKPGTGPRIAR